jgi:CRP/FNR family transcriptional regulator, cyclic AMP receptor protein
MQTRRVLNVLQKKQTGAGRSRVSEGRECLLTMDIFRDLAREDLEAMDQQTQHRTCRKGQIIYAQDERAERLFLLRQGRVHIYRLTPSGKRLALETIEAGTFFGEMPLLGESLRNAYSEAAVDSAICVLSRADVERVIREWPKVAFRIIEVLGQRLTLYQARLEEFAYRSVPARIAAVLLRMSDERPDSIVAFTHQELGDMVGAMRETVTTVLDEFQRAGVVELSRGRILLRDVEGLKAWLEE